MDKEKLIDNSIETYLQLAQVQDYYGDPEMLEMFYFHDHHGLEHHQDFHPLTQKVLRARADFIREELDELYRAIDQGDIDGVIDALVDQVVVIKGTALMMGLRWRKHWSEVHLRNMQKVRGYNPKRPDLKEDLIKPEGWTSPNHLKILETYVPKETYDNPIMASWSDSDSN